MENNRDFKGVWIPREVWLDDRLNALEKVILVEIDSLDSGDDHCWKSNESLAEFCQCSPTKVSNAVSKLIKLGYIRVHSFDGRSRKLQSCLTVSVQQPYNFCKADSQNLQESNTYSNTKSINTPIAPKGSLDVLKGFDEFWKAYPRKVAPSRAKKAWEKIKPDDSLLKIILNDLERKKSGAWRDTDEKFIPHPTTYLNQRRWEDETDDDNKQPETPWWQLPYDEQMRIQREAEEWDREQMRRRQA